MSIVGRTVIPEKRHLKRERHAIKTLEFPSSTGKSFFFHQNWNGENEMACAHRGRLTGMVAGYHQRNEMQMWLS